MSFVYRRLRMAKKEPKGPKAPKGSNRNVPEGHIRKLITGRYSPKPKR